MMRGWCGTTRMWKHMLRCGQGTRACALSTEHTHRRSAHTLRTVEHDPIPAYAHRTRNHRDGHKLDIAWRTPPPATFAYPCRSTFRLRTFVPAAGAAPLYFLVCTRVYVVRLGCGTRYREPYTHKLPLSRSTSEITVHASRDPARESSSFTSRTSDADGPRRTPSGLTGP